MSTLPVVGYLLCRRSGLTSALHYCVPPSAVEQRPLQSVYCDDDTMVYILLDSADLLEELAVVPRIARETLLELGLRLNWKQNKSALMPLFSSRYKQRYWRALSGVSSIAVTDLVAKSFGGELFGQHCFRVCVSNMFSAENLFGNISNTFRKHFENISKKNKHFE